MNEVTIETTNGGTPSRLWSTKNNGSRDYRVYTNGTMTITAPSGKNLSKIVFTAGSWTEPTASEGNISGKEWNGNASSFGTYVDDIVVGVRPVIRIPGSCINMNSK